MAQRCSHFCCQFSCSVCKRLARHRLSSFQTCVGAKRWSVKLAVASGLATSAVQHHRQQVHPRMAWHSLGASPDELTLEFTLPTGQSFRWRRTGDVEFTGVVDNRVVSCCPCQSFAQKLCMHLPGCAGTHEVCLQSTDVRAVISASTSLHVAWMLRSLLRTGKSATDPG